jgi:pyruvate,orthophosphate dikinase
VPLTSAFDDAPRPDRRLLGGKGAGLVEMTALGLPVPTGFVITTACMRAFLAEGRMPDALEEELQARMGALESESGRRFGDSAAPLLVSVRSGAPVSMPGMMDTVLNVGLTWEGAETLAGETGDATFAWGCFERLLEQFARTVRGLSAGVVEESLMDAGHERARALLELIERESGEPFPDARGQLRGSIEAVFRSWNSPRARAYRRHKGIDEDMGTAVVVQIMVFGNRGEDSGSGVAFTRDPSTGARGAYGDFLFDAQGEDVVAGERDTLPLAELERRLPAVAAELQGVFDVLERDARDMCDVEFTVEQGRLWILQTRVGQRSGRAAVRLAVAFAEEGLISVDEAVGRVGDEQLEAAMAPVFDDDLGDVVASGLAACPGAAVGVAAFQAERAQRLHEDGHDVVLVRPTTAPADLPGVIASVGVVTGRGGPTSHAAVVARGMGRPAVCGAGEVVASADGRSATVAGIELREGETVSVDGDRGLMSRGARLRVPAETDPVLARFLAWRDDSGKREERNGNAARWAPVK